MRLSTTLIHQPDPLIDFPATYKRRWVGNVPLEASTSRRKEPLIRGIRPGIGCNDARRLRRRTEDAWSGNTEFLGVMRNQPGLPAFRGGMGGVPMTNKQAYYRQRAEHCQRMAEKASCQEQTAFLMEAVRTWRLLGEMQELQDRVQCQVSDENSPPADR